MDAGFLNVVEIGHYFITKDTAEFSQFTDAVTCREYTLPREEGASEPKDWIRENTKIGPVLEVATCCLHGMYRVEIRIMSMKKDNSHSWVRISHLSHKLVTNFEQQWAGNSRSSARRIYVKTGCESKTTKEENLLALHQDSSYWEEKFYWHWTRKIFFPRLWSIVESNVSSSSFTTCASRRRWVVHFWWIKEKSSESVPAFVSLVWQQVESMLGRRRRFFRNNCVFPSSSRSFRTQSYWSFITGQRVIQSNFFQYTYHVRCAFNLHSLIVWAKRQTVFFLSVDPMDKSHKVPDVDLSVPRHAQYLHKAWKRHQDAGNWVDINLSLKKGLKFHQTRSNAMFLQETLPAYCIPKVVRMETGEVTCEKVYMSPPPPPKITLKHEWKRELGSEHTQRTEIGQLSRSFQSNQPILNPIGEWTGRPVIRDDARTVQDGRKTSRSQEIDVNSFHEESVSSKRTGRPVIETSVIQARSSEDSKVPNVGKAHERTRRLVIETNTENVPDSSQTRGQEDGVPKACV